MPDIHHRKRETEKQEIFTLSLFGKVRRQFELRKGIPADQRLIPICVSGPPKSHPPLVPPGPRGQFFTSAGGIFGRVPISADLYCAFYRDLLAHSRGGDKLNLIVTKRKLSDNVFLSFCILSFCRSEQLVELCWWKSWQGSDLWSLRLIGKSRHRLMRGN